MSPSIEINEKNSLCRTNIISLCPWPAESEFDVMLQCADRKHERGSQKEGSGEIVRPWTYASFSIIFQFQLRVEKF